jgi:hypothetical protein
VNAPLLAWQAQNAVRDVDRALRHLTPTPFDAASHDSLVLAGVGIVDEWEMMATSGFYQEPDKSLRLAPVIVYPGLILADYVHAEGAMKPPASKSLWLQIRHTLSPNANGLVWWHRWHSGEPELGA